tara:strand:- start:223 stop:381 length:159 start_codon:yes stop_codon:yes gene_type:complete
MFYFYQVQAAEMNSFQAIGDDRTQTMNRVYLVGFVTDAPTVRSPLVLHRQYR